MNNSVNPMFSKFDQALGKTTPTASSMTPVQSRAEEIRNIAKTSQSAMQTAQENANISNAPRNYVVDAGKRAVEDVKEAGNKVHDAIAGEGDYADQNPIRRGVEATGEAFATPLKVASEALPDIARKGLGKVGEAAGGIVNWLGEKLGDTQLAQDFVTKHPDAAKTLEETVGTLSAGGGIAGNILAVEGGVKGAEKGIEKMTPEPGEKAPVNMSEPDMKAPPVDPSKLPFSPKEMESSLSSPEVNKIQETISPKITSKETQAIINENRLTRGKESPIFGKQPDIVEQSEAIKRSAETIKNEIPGSHNMDDAQLSKALDTKTTEMAKNLSGEMKTVQIKPETTGKVLETWKKMKTEQQGTPEFLDNEAGNKAFQGKFENYLKELEWDITDQSGKFKAPTPKTLNDIWEVRKSYDQSIPSNVKNATEASSPVLQGRKTMWLQNRAILNSAINDTVEGLGQKSKSAFSNMSDMYDARENIMTKAKIDVKGKEGILPNTTKGWVKWGLGAGATLVGVDYALHKIGL